MPTFSNAKFRPPDPLQVVAVIDVEIDGAQWTLLADERNALFRELIASGVPIDEPIRPKPQRGK